VLDDILQKCSVFIFLSDKRKSTLFYARHAKRWSDRLRVEERTRDGLGAGTANSLKSILKMLKALAVFKYSIRKKMQPTAGGGRRISYFREISVHLDVQAPTLLCVFTDLAIMRTWNN